MENLGSLTPKIFWVNDNYNVLIMIKTLLEENGFSDVELFNNGSDLLERLKTCLPSLIISDIHMPEIDGFALLKSLKSSSDCRINQIPFILYSGTFNDYETRKLANEFGAKAFFNSPLDQKLFLETINKIFVMEDPAERGFDPTVTINPRGETRLLILEDDIFVSKFLLHSLKTLNYCMRGVSSVAEFNVVFKEFSPHVCILDYNLPDGNGMEVLKTIKAENPQIRAIMMTALSNENMIEDFIKEGADNFINKPINIRNLMTAVQTAAESFVPKPPARDEAAAIIPEPPSPVKALSAREGEDFFQNAPIPLALLDSNFNFVSYNHEFSKLVSRFGDFTRSASSAGLNFSAIMDPPSFERLRALMTFARDGGSLFRESFSFKNNDNSGNLIEMTISMNSSNPPAGDPEFRVAVELVRLILK
ncbi:MAG TPA: response regulator [Candidatus Wallbacteria bacterium]|nr:response regulator [Candidatus Wallbacteria bacterium]